MTTKAKAILLGVLASVTGTLWLLGSGFLIIAAIAVSSSGPNPVNWVGLFAFIGVSALVPLGLLVAAVVSAVREFSRQGRRL